MRRFVAPLGAAMAGLAVAVAVASGAPPQGSQTDAAFSASYAAKGVVNVSATTGLVSCYAPEVPYTTALTAADGYPAGGQTACPGATTGEQTSGFATQDVSNAPVLVKDKSESDIRVDPLNPKHLIGQSKWFVSAEGYNHLLGFYESWDGGETWPVQGHIPGYEGFTNNTDPIGAFDGFGNYYSLILPYQFAYYNGELGGGSKLYQKSKLPNAVMPAEAVTVAIRPHGARTASNWKTTRKTQSGVTYPQDLDFVLVDDNQGQEPDKQWITIDTHKYLPNGQSNPNYNTIYAMFVTFSFAGKMSKAYVSTAKALPGATHTDWSAPQRLPSENTSASDTYLLPHIDPNGVVWTSITNFPSQQSRTVYSLAVDYSTDGGAAWQGPLGVPGAQNVTIPPEAYDNTTFTDGIVNTFTVGSVKAHKTDMNYPLYMSWEDYGSGKDNILLSSSIDGGNSWSSPIRVNDNNFTDVDEFQPNLAAAANATVSVNFYDRRLACQTRSDPDVAGAGLELDTINPRSATGVQAPPYGAYNYCINTSVQFYTAGLAPIGHNIRISAHTWDPQLNAPWRYGSGLFSGKDTFIGDYFGNDFAGAIDLSTSVSTYDYGSNHNYYQQQVIARVAIPQG